MNSRGINFVRGRALVFAALIGSTTFEGCSCQGGSIVATSPHIEIEFPQHQSTVTSQNDVNSDVAGIQVNVQVVAENLEDGTVLVLTNSGATDATGSLISTTGKVSNGRASFEGYTLPVGELELKVRLETVGASEACDHKNCDAVTVNVVENVCLFNTPVDGAFLTQEPAEYADPHNPFDPFELDVILDCQGVDEGENVALVVDQRVPLVQQVDSTGRVVFKEVPLAEGANLLTALARTNDQGTNPAGSTAVATVTVSTGRCTTSLRPGDGTRLLAADDLNASIPGMQATIDILTDCPQSSTVSVYVRGPGDSDFVLRDPSEYDAPVLVAAPQTRLRIGNFFLPESVTPLDVQVIAVVSDPGGRSGTSLPVRYWVDSVRPVLTPDDPACIGQAYDGDANAPGVQLTSKGVVTGGRGGEVWVRVVDTNAPGCTDDSDCVALGAGHPPLCRQEVCRYVAHLPDDTNDAPAEYLLPGVDLPNGDLSLEYVAVDPAGNLSLPMLVNAFVFDSQPSISLVAPTDGAVLTSAADASSTLAGLQYNVQLALGGVGATSRGTVLITGQPAQTFTPSPGDSTPTLQVTLQDGARTITARVTDECGNVVQDSATVTVASTAADLQVNAFVAGSGFALPVPNGTVTTVGSVDLDVVLGGGIGEREVTVSYFDAVTGSPAVCTGNATQPSVQAVVDVAEGGAVFLNQSLAAGVNCMTVSVTGLAGTFETTYVINRRTGTSAPTITAPTSATLTDGDDSDGNATNGFNQNVVVGLAPAPDAPGTLTVQIAGGQLVLARLPVSPGADTVTFEHVGLPPGTYDIEAHWVDGYGLSAMSAPVTLDIQLSGPSVVVTAPLAGDVVRNAALEVVVVNLGDTEPSGCELYIDDFPPAGSPVADVLWPVGQPSVTLGGIPEQTEGEHALRVVCSDGATPTPNLTVVSVGTITIDDTGPGAVTFVDEAEQAPGRVVYVNGAFVNAATPMIGGGARHPVTLTVDGTLESLHGFRLELTSIATGDAPETQTLCLWEGALGPHDATCTAVLVTAGTTQNVTYPSVNFGSGAEGAIELSAVLIDAAGNPSEAAVVQLQKDTVPPEILQTKPSPTLTILTEAQDDNADTPQVDVEFRYNVSGAFAGASCALNPELCLRLTVTPEPENLSGGTILASVSAGQASYPLLTFADDLVVGYVATAQIADLAGNVATYTYNFDVSAVQPRLEWSVPNPAQPTINASFNGSFTALGAGFLAGSPVVLCTTSLPSNIPALTAGSCNPRTDLGCPCRWGSDGTLGGPNRGYVLRAGTLLGSLTDSGVDFQVFDLAEGSQVMHFEAQQAGGTPDEHTSFHTFVVDVQPPVVTAFDFDQNQTGNDGQTIRLGSGEGVSDGTLLTTSVTVTVSDSAAGLPVEVRRGSPTGTLIASTILDASLSATFAISLPEGLNQTVVVVARDAANNQGTLARVVDVDFTPPTVSVPATSQVFSSLDATPNTHGTGDRADDTLPISVMVTVADANLQGAGLTLQAFDADTGGAPLGAAQSVTMGGTQTNHVFTVELVAGVNWLQATLTDVFGNTSTSLVGGARQAYRADLYGPALTLSMVDAAGVLQSCGDSEGNACLADVLPPTDGITRFDRTGSDPYCPDAPCNSAGSDLRLELTECGNSGALEDCSVNPITVSLQSSLLGGSYVNVPNGVFGASGDIAPAESIADQPGAATYGFAGGQVRAVRLRAVDIHGNVSVSNALYIRLNDTSVVPEVALLDDTLTPFTPAVNLDDYANGTQYLGAAVSVAPTPGTFQGNLRVALPVVVPGQVPQSVVLSCAPDCRPGEPTITETGVMGTAPNYFVDIPGVHLPASSPENLLPAALDLEVTCDTGLCGRRTIDGIIADVDPPTYQFDRCQLCALGVPYAGMTSGCTGCGVHNDSDAADITGEDAVWNYDGDQDQPSGTPAFSIRDVPLRVLIRGLDAGESVAVVSNQAGALALSGNVRTNVTACESATTPCPLDFDALEVPSIPSNGSRHLLQVHFTDRAGNPAVPEPSRCSGPCDPADEQITALVDTLRPQGVVTTFCIGEDTDDSAAPPNGNEDDTTCPVVCSSPGVTCDRRAGMGGVHFAAPEDDGGTGGVPVEHYELLIAALDIPYNGTTHTDCSTVLPGANVERVLVPEDSPTSPGEEQILPITGLFPHRTYCVAVVGIDDAGNRADVGTFQAERALPLLTDVPGFGPPPSQQPFPRLSPFVDGDAGAFVADEDGAVGLGWRVANVGDMDGDTLDDFAVTSFNEFAVDFYFSGNLGSPRRLYRNTAFGMGARIAAGDFDGDGLSDVAFCGPTSNNGGAVYLYYGVAGTGFGTANNNLEGAIGWDSSRPSPELPNVTLYGPADAYFCDRLVMADVDGTLNANGAPSADLVIGVYGEVSSLRRVLGFRGGARSRFTSATLTVNPNPQTLWNPATGASIGAASSQPDFVLRPRTGAPAGFPLALTAGDFNGDGIADVAVSHRSVNHGKTGEVYIYAGGNTLQGAIPAPETLTTCDDPCNPPGGDVQNCTMSAPLMHILRFRNDLFGSALATIPAPVANDAADWLYAHAGDTQGIIFQASAAQGGVVPRDGRIAFAGVYPRSGTDCSASPLNYRILDSNRWDGTSPSASFGRGLAVLGEFDGAPGVDIALAPEDSQNGDVFLYSYTAAGTSNGTNFQKRAILRGASGFFGASVTAITDHFGVNTGTQLVVTSHAFGQPGRVFLFR